jgi:hypothetical protein
MMREGLLGPFTGSELPRDRKFNIIEEERSPGLYSRPAKRPSNVNIGQQSWNKLQSDLDSRTFPSDLSRRKGRSTRRV